MPGKRKCETMQCESFCVAFLRFTFQDSDDKPVGYLSLFLSEFRGQFKDGEKVMGFMQ